MKGSERNRFGLNYNLSYTTKNIRFSNNTNLNYSKGNNSPWGSYNGLCQPVSFLQTNGFLRQCDKGF